MIDRKALLNDCKGLMRTLEEDLIARSHGDTGLREAVETLKEEFRKAQDAKRTAQNFEDWRTDYATQQAAAWVLSAVFVRFLEDNELIDPPQLAGHGDRLKRARDQHEMYFRSNPTETDREYLLHVFAEVGKLPGGREIFGKYNSVFEMPHWLSGDAAGAILKFLQKIDADTGNLVHDFTDPEWDTRFLGDLYQDLSEAARKKYALLQTPEFVEEFILDRTLDPALDEFGLDAPAIRDNNGDPITESGFRMIDPACGSGHFLLGSFRRILDRWQRMEPGTNVRELVQRSLDSVNGVDVNPFATAIARFRLLIAALSACKIRTLRDAPAFHFSLTAGDSLLHGAPGVEQQLLSFDPLAHHYQVENIGELRRMLRSGTFHAVVANPPYATVKDRVLSQSYRERYSTCHAKYSLAVPFFERFFGLAVSCGFVGQITANSFMKRTFGKKLIENFIPSIDLTHVIDMSGVAFGSKGFGGIPTLILFGRQRLAVAKTLRAILGISGEPSIPADPSSGRVWSTIESLVDIPGSENEFVSVIDSPREMFHRHPWSLGGGGAAELKEVIENQCEIRLGDKVASIGYASFPGLDDPFVVHRHVLSRSQIAPEYIKPYIDGESVRNWEHSPSLEALAPYGSDFNLIALDDLHAERRWLWVYRTSLSKVMSFGGKTREELGDPWWGWYRWIPKKYAESRSLAFANMATHNHLSFGHGGHVYNGHAPVIKLAEGTSDDDYYSALGLLNSSTACFWMRQTFHNMGAGGGTRVEAGRSPMGDESWESCFEFDGTKMKLFPIPHRKPNKLPRELDDLSQSAPDISLDRALATWTRNPSNGLRKILEDSKRQMEEHRGRMISLQEELDWVCYDLYGLLDGRDSQFTADTPVSITLGERAFEISLARKMASEDSTTNWFRRHDSTPIAELPEHWPQDYKQLVERRIEISANDKTIGLIERTDYKRRWSFEPWESQLEGTLKKWLLDRLESYFDFDGRMNEEAISTAKVETQLTSLIQLSDVARRDREFQEVGEIYTDDSAFDVTQLISELVTNVSVPHLSVLRYKTPGLRKLEEWEKTWVLQRQEDAIEARVELPEEDPNYLTKEQAERTKKQEVGDIPVPPKYKSSDFLKGHYWKLRGKLDVPKERWVSFPYCEGQDGTLMIAWAGYDHLQLARSISAHYVDVQERIGGRDDPRLVPLLASLIELLPWLKQWHNEVDPEFNMAMGDYFEGFIQEEARGLGMTLDEIRAWEPPKKTKTKKKRKPKKKAAAL